MNIVLRNSARKSVFLAGSIEMGVAENWQDRVGKFFEDLGYDVFNPRREEWDSSWEQKFENPQFYQQVNWELNALESADLIIMYFDPSTKSPISLLELGLFARSGKLRVVCPDGFWRKGNVEITCNYYNIPLHNNLDTLFLDLG
jgi:hypothetical protein